MDKSYESLHDAVQENIKLSLEVIELKHINQITTIIKFAIEYHFQCQEEILNSGILILFKNKKWNYHKNELRRLFAINRQINHLYELWVQGIKDD